MRDGQYDGNGGNTYGASQGYAWDESGNFDVLASSSNVVDDESLIIKMAGSISSVTPAGTYSVSADFVAVPSY